MLDLPEDAQDNASRTDLLRPPHARPDKHPVVGHDSPTYEDRYHQYGDPKEPERTGDDREVGGEAQITAASNSFARPVLP